MSTPYRRDLERLQYWQGQTLRSRDARDQGRFDALRRQLHNRALHATNGIAFGLQVQPVAGNAQGVEVACGLAYDLRGRELILQHSRRALLPAQASWLVLRVRSVARDSASCRVPVDPGCMPPAGRLLEDDVELAWVALASHDASGGVVLARFDGKQLDAGFMPVQARPLAKPRLARGETVKGNTPWEPWIVEQPDGQGGFTSKVVGVQTHIDTSASGFTKTPQYMANVQAEEWGLAKAEFAPAFFPQVADPAPDGFTFRLLMTEIARRRYSAWFGSARVTSTTRIIGDQLSIEVDDGAVFKQGDVIAQLRPRARGVVTLAASTSSKLTLDGPLADLEAGKLLAVGNLPRMASVTGIPSDDRAMVAAYTAAPAVKKGDVLLRTSDGALALIDRVSAGLLTVEEPPLDWKTTDALEVARLTGAAQVTSAALSADGTSLVLDLKPSTHGIAVGMRIVMLDGEKQPLANTHKVTTRNSAAIEVRPVPSAADIAAVARVAPFAGGLTIQSLSAKKRSIVEVDDVAPFAIGDFVAPADDPTQIAVIEQVQKGKKQLGLSSKLDGLAVGSKLVAADWQCATTIDHFDPKHPQAVEVGRVDAARAGDFVALRANDEFASPVSVAMVSDVTLTLATPLDGAVRLDTLAVGRFGRVATVMSQRAQKTQLTIAEAGALVAGDCVMLWPAWGSVSVESAVVPVASASGKDVVLANSLGALSPGDRIATVQWRDRVSVTSFNGGAHPTEIGIDGNMAFGANDVVGVLSYHADASNGAYVQKIEGKVLTLSAGIMQGDGIVDQRWIDGGIVGPAALAWQPSVAPEFPATWQPLVRMDTLEGFDSRKLATAYGLDLVTGVFQSRAVQPLVLDEASQHLWIYSQAQTPVYRFRPETLSLITSFNNDFPAAFVTFAQKQELVVRWFGCQQEFPPAGGCPGQAPWDPCVTGAEQKGLDHHVDHR